MAETMERAAIYGSVKASKPDAYTPWYTIWCGAFLLWNFVVGYFDDIYNLYLLIVPVIFLPLLVLAGALVISFAVNVLRRRWCTTLSIIAAPVIALSVLGLLHRLGMTPETVAGIVRLELSKSSYMAQINALPTTDGPRLKCWDWGGTGGAAVANIVRTLVYDESDQIALPRSSWSAAWLRKADEVAKGNSLYSVIRPTSGTGQISVSHLEGHFYVVEEVYQ
jgi:hypothetical protein